jgi:formylmethanofuran dehydrogenase subunit C
MGPSPEDVKRFCMAISGIRNERALNPYLGLFLSAVINHGDTDGFEIDVTPFASLIPMLCWKNRKDVVIIGEPGHNLGEWMESGSISVKGPAGFAGWFMGGGTITVEGDATHSMGHLMKGGTMIIKGNVLEGVGAEMQGGLTHVLGNASRDAGRCMEGGELVIEGNGGDWLGSGMKGGIIRVKGNAGNDIGRPDMSSLSCMEGGEIHIDGDIGSISDRIGGGRIFHRGKLIVDK